MTNKRTSANRRIAIDFDGVLHAYSAGWQDGRVYDGPVDGARTAVEKLVKRGYSYFVFTTRVSKERKDVDWKVQEAAIYAWLADHQFPMPEMVTAEKHPALAYIDDRAVRFTNWEDIRKLWT